MAARVNERPHLHHSRPVRRVLFYVFVVATIYLGPPLPMASSNLPADIERAILYVCCSVLLRMGFTKPMRSPATLVSSYLTFSPLLLTQRFLFCGTFPRVTPGGC